MFCNIIYLLVRRCAALVPHGQRRRDTAGHEVPRDIDDARAYIPDLREGVLEEVELVGIAFRTLVDDLYGTRWLAAR